MLSIVSTPIGNLEDITLRAIRTLKEADLIASEDTRHTGRLLKHFEVETPQISFHSHSGRTKLDKIITALHDGQHVALVSDAGTPGISDPGYLLIRRAIEEGIKVEPIPGPSSLLAALVTSGLPMDKFVYLGFLPTKKGRKTLLEGLKQESRTIILFESPHRLHKTLNNLVEAGFENHQLVIARELTKLHETIYRGTVSEIIAELEGKKLKGEMVLVLHSGLRTKKSG
jgi:16S rRNA (cytidine1402-2'-O)-methyltransferase